MCLSKEESVGRIRALLSKDKYYGQFIMNDIAQRPGPHPAHAEKLCKRFV